VRLAVVEQRTQDAGHQHPGLAAPAQASTETLRRGSQATA
jgi:hypothetical protein